MKKQLIGLDSTSYEHPFDKKALSAFKALKGVDMITNFVLDWTYLKWHLVELAGSNFHVTEYSCPELYAQVKRVADTLDITRIPSIYTEWGHFINAYTTGYKDSTLLVLYSGAVDLLDEEELAFIVGHEMGHIKSGHVLYHVMAGMFSNIISNMAIAAPLVQPLYYALMYWNRMSEFTADRAGLLACQNVDAAINAIVKNAWVNIIGTTDSRHGNGVRANAVHGLQMLGMHQKTGKLVTISLQAKQHAQTHIINTAFHSAVHGFGVVCIIMLWPLGVQLFIAFFVICFLKKNISTDSGFFKLAIIFHRGCGNIYIHAANGTVFVFDGLYGLN